MKTSCMNTPARRSWPFAFAVAVAMALLGTGCEGAEEGDDATEAPVAETQQALTGTIDPAAVELQKKITACKAAGGVWVSGVCRGNSGNPIDSNGG